MRQIFISAFMLVLAITAFGQHVIKGKVTDENGNALNGATVVLENNSISRITDKNGSFLFTGLTEANYTLTASYVGFKTTTAKVNVNKEVTVVLKTIAISINEIIVNPFRANNKSPMAFTNIDKETLSKSNLGQDVPYLLSITPSFVATSDAGNGIGYTGFRIRGTDASRINVTINGVPYNDADEQGTYWVDIPDFASSLENIQVQRGVGTSTNGAAAFGANISMQTDNFTQKAFGELNLSVGSFNTIKQTVKAGTGLINGHWAIDARLSTIKSDGYIDRASVDMKSYFIQAGYYDEKTSIKFLTFGGVEKTYHAWDGVDSYELPTLAYPRTYNPCGYMGDGTDGNPLYYQNQTDNYRQTNYQLVGFHAFTPELSLNAAFHYTRGDGYYEEYKGDQSFYKYSLSSFDLNDTTTISSSDLVRQKKMSNDFAGLVFSFNYSKDKLKAQLGGGVNNYWGQHWGDVIWVKNYIGDIYPITEYYRSDVSKLDANIYLKANYDLSSKFNLYGDLQCRYVNYKLNGTNDEWDDAINNMQILNINKIFSFFNPKFGAFYSPNKLNDIFASFSIANREPTRTNYTDGTPGLWPKPETLYDTELGYKYHNSKLALGLNLYYMHYKNQLILTGKINDIGEALTSNIDNSFRSGIELTASYKPFVWLKWDGTATCSYNRIKEFTETVNVLDDYWEPTGKSVDFIYKNAPIAFSPSLLSSSMFTFIHKAFEIGFQSAYVGKQYVDNTGRIDRELPAYFINNLRLSYSIPTKKIRAIDFTLLINNLFNEKYISGAWSSPYIAEDTANPVYNQNSTVYNYFGCYPQAGINILAGATIKF